MKEPFQLAVEEIEKRLSEMVEGRLLQIAEGAAKHYKLNIKPKDDINWAKIIEEAETNPETFEIVKLKCSRVLRLGEYLEPILNQWLCDYLDGIIKPPKKMRGAPKKSGGKDFFLACLIANVHEKYSFPISRNEATISQSACDVVSNAIKNINRELRPTEYVKPTSYNELRQLYYKFKKGFGIGQRA